MRTDKKTNSRSNNTPSTNDAREHRTAKHHKCDARSGPWAHRTQYSRVWLWTVVIATARNPSTTGGEKKGKPFLQFQAEWARDPTRNGL